MIQNLFSSLWCCFTQLSNSVILISSVLQDLFVCFTVTDSVNIIFNIIVIAVLVFIPLQLTWGNLRQPFCWQTRSLRKCRYIPVLSYRILRSYAFMFTEPWRPAIHEVLDLYTASFAREGHTGFCQCVLRFGVSFGFHKVGNTVSTWLMSISTWGLLCFENS